MSGVPLYVSDVHALVGEYFSSPSTGLELTDLTGSYLLVAYDGQTLPRAVVWDNDTGADGTYSFVELEHGVLHIAEMRGALQTLPPCAGPLR